jgi:hypothetical protein
MRDKFLCGSSQALFVSHITAVKETRTTVFPISGAVRHFSSNGSSASMALPRWLTVNLVSKSISAMVRSSCGK